MDGDIAPLDKIVDLAKKYDAFTLVDECHATGVLGRTGHGTFELHGMEDRADVITSTLGKALGGASGGYTAGPKEVIDVLRNKGRPYLFSNSIAPPIVGARITHRLRVGGNVLPRRRLQRVGRISDDRVARADGGASG